MKRSDWILIVVLLVSVMILGIGLANRVEIIRNRSILIENGPAVPIDKE